MPGALSNSSVQFSTKDPVVEVIAEPVVAKVVVEPEAPKKVKAVVKPKPKVKAKKKVVKDVE